MAKELTDRITYTELRTINIGDYESIKAHLSYSTSIRKINEKEKVLTIMASETIDVEEDQKAFDETVKRATSRVRKVLNAREINIRARTARFTEHDTETKGLIMKLIDIRNWRKKKETVQVDYSEIDDMENGEANYE